MKYKSDLQKSLISNKKEKHTFLKVKTCFRVSFIKCSFFIVNY